MAITKNKEGTKKRILAAARKLFAERGFEGVALREITSAAKANVAAVNYHFGNKDQLIDQIIISHTKPIVEERMRLLNIAKEAASLSNKPVPVREILDAFIRPLLTVVNNSGERKNLFCKLSGRCMSDRGSDLPQEIVGMFGIMIKEFTSALGKALPDLDPQLVLWRLHFSFGVMAHTLTYEENFYHLTHGACGKPDLNTSLQRIIDYCHGGLLAENSLADEMKGGLSE